MQALTRHPWSLPGPALTDRAGLRSRMSERRSGAWCSRVRVS